MIWPYVTAIRVNNALKKLATGHIITCYSAWNFENMCGTTVFSLFFQLKYPFDFSQMNFNVNSCAASTCSKDVRHKKLNQTVYNQSVVDMYSFGIHYKMKYTCVEIMLQLCRKNLIRPYPALLVSEICLKLAPLILIPCFKADFPFQLRFTNEWKVFLLGRSIILWCSKV